MKGNPAVIASLLAAAEMEAKLATQYLIDRRDLRFQGLKKLGKRLAAFGEDCQSTLREMLDKVFLLGGSPSYSAGVAVESPSVTAIMQAAHAAETAIVDAFNDFYLEAQDAKDADTRNQYEHWIKMHEHDHISWLEQQLAQIEEFGEAEYLKIQLGLE